MDRQWTSITDSNRSKQLQCTAIRVSAKLTTIVDKWYFVDNNKKGYTTESLVNEFVQGDQFLPPIKPIVNNFIFMFMVPENQN